MKDSRCFVCKYVNPKSERVEFNGVLYNHAGESCSINLCWSHSVKFFKMGQFKFFNSYLHIIMAQHGQPKDERILKDFGILEYRPELNKDLFK